MRRCCPSTDGLGTDPEHLHHASYIIAWGANIHGNNIHLWPMIEEARRKGAKLIVIDPYETRTAKLADWHIAINPEPTPRSRSE